MSGQQPIRTVRLKEWKFPNYWEESVTPVVSGQAVVQRLRQLLDECVLGDAEGAAFLLEDGQDNELQVYCSTADWSVAFYPADRTPLITRGMKSARGTKPFLIPEWTEVERKHLIDAEKAAKVVVEWVESGTLTDDVDWCK